jgi:predicted site-specific integrase-resolvase
MIDQTLARSSPPQGKRRESWRDRAKRLGVSVKTLDRWAQAGILPPPEYINGRKYGDPDDEPRQDGEPQEAAE